MSDIAQGIDAYFWLTAITLICGGLNLFVRFAYKSKCKRCKICCIVIERDIETEEREDLAAVAMMNTNPSIEGVTDGQRN
jgi:hypothetical protein